MVNGPSVARAARGEVNMRVLVTGATGYIGGRLVPRLLEQGYAVRVLVRDASRIAGRSWSDQVQIAQGDLLDSSSLEGVFDDIDAAYYLVHSMGAGRAYGQRDPETAETFCRAASGLRHVIYLGGLLPESATSSKHLFLRAETGRILAAHMPTTELRAGPIIGSGSASFEMLRYLTERHPMMLAPRWVLNEVTPIAVRDVLSYLVAALERGPSGILGIGTEHLTYKEMMTIYARVRGLQRAIISVPPVLPASFGARWIGWMTPIPSALAAPLIGSMSQELHANTDRARELFPAIQPMSYERAVKRALMRIEEHEVETRWSGALTDAPSYEYHDREGMIREVRTAHVLAPPEAVYGVFSGLGGDRGWLAWRWAWRARGMLDRMIGGPGLRRGRRHPQVLLPGEAVDFWRVETAQPPRLLRLRAEMRLPGLAWLEWEATSESGGTQLTQTAAFAPRGLLGALYWYVLYPFHRLIFTDMINAIAAESLRSLPAEQT